MSPAGKSVPMGSLKPGRLYEVDGNVGYVWEFHKQNGGGLTAVICQTPHSEHYTHTVADNHKGNAFGF